jgi:hypothetical protein
MSSIFFAQRYVDGRSLLCYLSLFNTMNGTLNPPGRLPKPLQTHGKRAVLFEAHFTTLANDQFLTSLP